MIKPCKKCGSTEKYKNGACIPCMKKRVREWKLANPNRVKQLNKKSREKNIDQIREKAKARKAISYYQNIEKTREERRRYYYANQEKEKAKHREWKRNNRENSVKHTQLDKARKAGVEIEPYNFSIIREYYGNICLCCRRNNVKLTVDHIVPISMGGGDIIQNIQPLCGSCNSKKSRKIIDYRPLPYPSEYVKGYLAARKVMG